MSPKITGVRVGIVVGIGSDGRAIVDYPGNPFGPLMARRTASVSAAAIARALRTQTEVLLTFQDQNPGSPIIFDVIDDEPMSTEGSVENESDHDSTAGALPVPAIASESGTSARIARIVSIHDNRVSIDFPGNTAGPLPAKTTVPLRNLKDDVLVILATEGPIIVGQLCDTIPIALDSSKDGAVVLRGSSIRIEATDEITVTAGASRIHLDARGKATTTADQVVSRARGVNKVQGGCIKLN
jgi:hypothetical protein